jgi:K+-transporting ATPase ATPase B chain
MSSHIKAVSAWEGPLLRAAIRDSVRKLDPRLMVRNPVMFVVEVGSLLTTLLWLRDLIAPSASAQPAWFSGLVTLWLWFTVLFANFAAARRRRLRCAACARRRWRASWWTGANSRCPHPTCARATSWWSRPAR